jgi:hypothetical protein
MGESLTVLYTSQRSMDAAKHLGYGALLAAAPRLRSIACIPEHARLEPCFAAACESVFERQPGVGLVSPWILLDGVHKDLDPGPTPVSLAGVTDAELPPCSALRVEVILQAQNFHVADAQPCWETLADGGWSAVTYPGMLVSVHPPANQSARNSYQERRFSGMALIQSGSAQFALQWFLKAPWPEKAKWLGRIFSHPQRVARWMSWQIRRAVPGL